MEEREQAIDSAPVIGSEAENSSGERGAGQAETASEGKLKKNYSCMSLITLLTFNAQLDSPAPTFSRCAIYKQTHVWLNCFEELW